MAIAVDASTPIRWAGLIVLGGDTIVSASFTPPANSLLVCCVNYDGNTTNGTPTVTADTAGLTWTQQVQRTWQEGLDGGYSAIFTCPQTSSASRICTLTFSQGGALQASAKLYVLTGVDLAGTPVDTVGASNEGDSTTDSMTTTSLTPGATGLLFAVSTDYNVQGVFDASSDLTQDTATYATLSVCSGYKTCTSGVGVTANLNAGGASPQHKWSQIIARQSASTTPGFSSSPFLVPITF